MDPPPPQPARVHVTVRSRAWWDAQFASVGCTPNTYVLDRAQRRMDPLTDNMRRGCVAGINPLLIFLFVHENRCAGWARLGGPRGGNDQRGDRVVYLVC